MKKHQFNLIFVLNLLLIFALACNFKFGETSSKEDSQKENSTNKPKDEYPFDWANKHIVANVNLYLKGVERSWYLLEGVYLSGKKISKLD